MNDLSQARWKARRTDLRRAFSLLELTVVILLMGLVVTAGVGRFGGATLENLSAEGYARRLALALAQARERTVATGDNHYVAITDSGGAATSYTVLRRTGSGDAVVEQATATPAGLTVAASHTALEFDFDGSALAAYSVSVAGPHRSWSITTTPLTGAVQTVETTP